MMQVSMNLLKSTESWVGLFYKKIDFFFHPKCHSFHFFPKGCELMFIPAAYEERFGPWLWELSQRSRACDNQLFVVAISPAKNPKANYVCYGHSMVVDPCGTIITEAGSGEEIVCTELGRQFLIFSDLNQIQF